MFTWSPLSFLVKHISSSLIFVHLNSHSFTCFHSEQKQERGGKREREVASYVKIYAVFSDVVIMHSRALLHRTLWQAWLEKHFINYNFDWTRHLSRLALSAGWR